MKKKTKILSLIIALMLSVGLIPSTVFQAYASEVSLDDNYNLDIELSESSDNEETVYNVAETQTTQDSYITNPVVNVEITTLPDKTFTEPLFTCSLDEYLENGDWSWSENNKDNSISRNMHGAELTVYRQDGTVTVVPFAHENKKGNVFAANWYDDDFNYMSVSDLGNYKARIQLLDPDSEDVLFTIEFTAKNSSDTPVTNPTLKAEMTALPTKVFNEPLYTCTIEEFENTGIEQDKVETYLNNSIAKNMDGAEITIYNGNETALALPFTHGTQAGYMHISYYFHYDLGYVLKVTDLGNFNARIDVFDSDDEYYYDDATPLCTTEFTANHAPAPQPTVPVPTPEYTTVLTDNDSKISVKGNFDSETSLNVEKTTVQLDGAKIAYDITLTKNGVEIQPDSEITVSIPYSEKGCKVYWVKADGTTEDMNATYTDGYYAFTTTHLSTYAVVATTDSPSNNETKPSTVDTATTDTTNKGTNDNGTVQTGNPVTAFAVLMLVALASGIVFIYFNRKSKI